MIDGVEDRRGVLGRGLEVTVSELSPEGLQSRGKQSSWEVTGKGCGAELLG